MKPSWQMVRAAWTVAGGLTLLAGCSKDHADQGTPAGAGGSAGAGAGHEAGAGSGGRNAGAGGEAIAGGGAGRAAGSGGHSAGSSAHAGNDAAGSGGRVAGRGGSGGAADDRTCSQNSDCSYGEIDHEILKKSDCLCLFGCASLPLNKQTISRRQSQYTALCDPQRNAQGQPCPIDDCVQLPAASCIDQVCVAGQR